MIVEAVRTPIGRYGGALATVRPDDLAAIVLRALVDRAGLDPGLVEDVILGCANQAGEDNRNVARMAMLLAGFPTEVGGLTVNRLCGSGLQAINSAAHAIAVGDGDVFIGGGVESMTRAPYVTAKPVAAWDRGDREMFDTTLGWRFINPRLAAAYYPYSMGETAENVAERWGVSRERLVELDQVEIADVDAGSLERLASRGHRADAHDGRIHSGHGRGSTAVAGVDPAVMGIGPVPATRKALERAGIDVGDLDLIELNEAFASQSLVCIDELGLDPAKVNVNGGAIALGHPLGMSGGRLITMLTHELRRTGGRYGLATMCIGVGQGIATVIERLDG